MQDIYLPHQRRKLVVPKRTNEPAPSTRVPKARPQLARSAQMIDGISRPVGESAPVTIGTPPAPIQAVVKSASVSQKPHGIQPAPHKVASVASTRTLVEKKPAIHTGLTPTKKQQHLEAALAKARREIKRERRKTRDLKRFGLAFLAGLLVLATGYVSIDTIITNNNAKAILSNDSKENAAPAAVPNEQAHTQNQEGKDESDRSAHTLANYSVAPDVPRALYIDKLKVAARVLPMATNKDGSVQAPVNIFDSGWYTGSVKPGQIGAMFIDGHASGPTRQGLFGNLDRLVKGDTLQVEKGDGKRLTYKVVHTETLPLEGLDMNKVLLPYGRTLRGLNLMTCTGTWIQSKQTFDHRVVVYTEQV